MSYWVIYAEQTGPLAGMASYDRIQDLFSRSRLADLAGGGSWASRVRVTRTGGVSSLGQGQTTAAALYQFPDYYSDHAKETALQNLRASVNGMLEADGQSGHNAWQTLTIVPYNPSQNGPLSFWQCESPENCAANTMTKNQNPAMQNPPYENPTGPTIQGVNAIRDSDKFNFTPVYIVGGLVAAVFLAPTINSIVKTILGEKPAAKPQVESTSVVTAEPTPVEVRANRNVKWL